VSWKSFSSLSLLLGAGALSASPASAQYAWFSRETDTILVPINSVIGTDFTLEAVVMLCPDSAAPAHGVVFTEQYDAVEDKALSVGLDGLGGTAFRGVDDWYSVAEPMVPGNWLHIAFVCEGEIERLYLDGVLYGSRARPGAVGNHPDSAAQVGAFLEPAGLERFRASFTGYLESFRFSSVARYAGESFASPVGDLSADANTLLLYNFDDPPGSPSIADSSGNGLNGIPGTGFAGATAPQIVSSPGCPTGATPYCFGLSCPCQNGSPARIRGCLNSTARGARLYGTGWPSLSADSLRLLVSILPANTPGLFFQGTASVQNGNGLPFGDGLRCSAGSVVRLVVRFADGNGRAEYPRAGETPISVLGGVQLGATHYYQYWYRDTLGPCGSGFNLTNGQQAIWMP
jgi:hypothetical protein